MSTNLKLTIVVTVVDGGRYLRDCLLAIMAMEDAPPLEIIVPYDTTIDDTKLLADEFPHINFIDMGVVTPVYPLHTQSGQHELYDRRRSCGLKAATGDIIGMLEDRGHPSRDWAKTVVQLHALGKYNVIGGAIECMEPVSLMHWAFYVTDFGRYGRPFESGPVSWVSDINVSYTPKALADTRELWTERFWEMIVHRALMDQGQELYLSNELVVNHRRPPVTFANLLRERRDWGNLFGFVRTKRTSALERIGLIVMSPLIPPVLWVRHGLIQAQKGRGLRYLAALPYIIMMTTAWTLGEVKGYITRRP